MGRSRHQAPLRVLLRVPGGGQACLERRNRRHLPLQHRGVGPCQLRRPLAVPDAVRDVQHALRHLQEQSRPVARALALLPGRRRRHRVWNPRRRECVLRDGGRWHRRRPVVAHLERKREHGRRKARRLRDRAVANARAGTEGRGELLNFCREPWSRPARPTPPTATMSSKTDIMRPGAGILPTFA